MGIGNTSTSSAMLMCYRCTAEVAVGKGQVNGGRFYQEKRIIEQAIR